MAEISDEAIEQATGRSRKEWFKLLDKWDAAERAHKEIAEHLATKHRMDGWWAQMVTVDYERARGLRDVGQRPSGAYETTLQRTLDADPKTVEAFVLERGRDIHPLLAGEPKTTNTRQGRVLRWRHEEDRVQVVLTPKPPARCVVHVTHAGLASAKARDDAKARWTHAVAALSERLG